MNRSVKVKVRARVVLNAFQWDGAECEGFARIGVGIDRAHQPVFNLVAVNLYGVESFAEPGDWLVEGCFGGHFVYKPADFESTYEVVGE